MKMDIVAGSGNDEYYTPTYAVTPILKYISHFKNVWCPFDTHQSNFVIEIKRMGLNVIHTHIDNGQDFFKTETPECDVIVSNPPYSKRGEVLQNCFDRDKPFALLLGVVGLFESEKRFSMFKDNSFEILYFNRRISFFKDFNDQKPSVNPPFSSAYITRGLLPKQICFERLVKI